MEDTNFIIWQIIYKFEFQFLLYLNLFSFYKIWLNGCQASQKHEKRSGFEAEPCDGYPK